MVTHTGADAWALWRIEPVPAPFPHQYMKGKHHLALSHCDMDTVLTASKRMAEASDMASRSLTIIAMVLFLLILTPAFLNSSLADREPDGGQSPTVDLTSAVAHDSLKHILFEKPRDFFPGSMSLEEVGDTEASLLLSAHPSVQETNSKRQVETRSVQPDVLPAACSYILKPTGACFDSGAHGGAFEVDPTMAACSWTAASNDSWITITGGSSGTGIGFVGYQVSSNVKVAARQGTITVAGQTYTVSQDGFGSCAMPLMPAAQTFSGQGGSGTTLVPQLSRCASCTWTAASAVSWITITSTTTTSFSYTIAPNTSGATRMGTVNAAGQEFTVTESGCSYAISPASQSFGISGGSGSFNLTTTAECSWMVSVNVPWVHITSTGNESGSAQVTYSVDANPSGPTRSGSISIADQVFSISQDGSGCDYSLSPGSLNTGTGAATGTINITTASTCAWTAIANERWISITSSPTGMGNGSVNFSVAPNSGAARTGTVGIANQTFTINQSGQGAQVDLSASIVANPQPVAAGTRLTYTTTVTNSGPDTATGVTLTQTIPDGATFSSVPGGATTAPNPGGTGMIQFSLGDIPSGESTLVFLIVNVLASPGSTLTTVAMPQSADSGTFGSASNSNQIKGGGVINLTWIPSQPTGDNPIPPPTHLTIGVASASESASLAESAFTSAEWALMSDAGLQKNQPERKPRDDSGCTPIGINIYLSTTTPVEAIPANLWQTVPPNTSSANMPTAPPGTFYVLTTVFNCGGTIMESSPSNTAGIPAGPSIDSVTVGSKIKGSGSGFDPQIQLFIEKIGFEKAATLKKPSLVVQKGSLSNGNTITQAVSGKRVLITFQNPDGGKGTYSFIGN